MHGVTAQTPDRLFIDAGAVYLDYGLPGQRLLGATRGGNEFNLNRTFREMPVDGAQGPVKGMRRKEEVRPQITANMLELTKENLLKAIAGATETSTPATEDVDAEYLGAGDGVTVAFNIANFPVVAGSEKIYVDGVLQVRDTDYTIDNATGVVTFVAAPANTAAVTASYSYETGDASTHDTITGGEILDSSYITNVALVGKISGKGDPVIVIVKNALCDGGFSFSTAPMDEAVPQVVFTGHFDPSDLDTEPWEIRYPRA